MITSRSKVSRIGFAALLLAGVGMPALGQDTPESLLPPGFDDPAPTPAPAPGPSAAPTRAAEPALPAEPTVSLPDNAFGNFAEAAAEQAAAIDLSKYELPEFAKHSLDRVGVFAAGNAAFPADSFGETDGRFLQVLMRRMDAPIASRWASIVLRRALMSPLNTPAGVNGADFAADRAWTLLRMGEANAARAVIEDVDTDNYTTWLYQVAMQTALANGDPAALCPIADKGSEMIAQRGWALAQAMCAGLAGKPNEAGQLFSRARSGTSPSDIDNLLAEKVLGTGAQGRRAVTIEWNAVTQLSAWRWGLATATGVDVPAELYQSAGPQVRYWQALAPNIDPAARATAAELAATAGVFSNAGLVDLYSEIEQGGDSGDAQTVARDLRTAYTDGDVSARVQALRTLWDAATTPRTRYARLILTARAASWIPANDKVEEADRLIASMLSSGYEAAALEWRGVVKPGSEGWALLALADPGGSQVAAGDVTGFADAGSRRKAQMLLAGLAGLGRMGASNAQSAATALDVQIGGTNAWTQAIDAAGQRGDAATVALLAGVGMQSLSWDYVAPEALFHIVAAMRAAGMVNYARMIAVEAVTRSA
ncbi:hypothetical protein MZO42_19885 [Sphingomonas psychrotolerans]|uniref:Uncharacterized protein n=1 Tax=Sphingomonas psychrotolerans TaxID=1327635 RepID=A0ABU3NAZ5_9SPHN|nr:hypothetical protein [Sphingomonas psychrotolerans]MDT8760967.1 hypothetical protein [Sphingomonas psychrotolerans]